MTALFHVDNITFGFGTKTLFNNFSLSIPEASITGILGPNGSGKTTLLRLLQGLHQPNSGHIFFRKKSIKTYAHPLLAQHISSVPQRYAAPPFLTVREFVAMGRYPFLRRLQPLSHHDENIVEQSLAETHIAHLATQALHTLSGGEQQRALWAQALTQTPDVLLLDEPFSALDSVHKNLMIKLLHKKHQEKNISVLIVVHDEIVAQQLCHTTVTLQ